MDTPLGHIPATHPGKVASELAASEALLQTLGFLRKPSSHVPNETLSVETTEKENKSGCSAAVYTRNGTYTNREGCQPGDSMSTPACIKLLARRLREERPRNQRGFLRAPSMGP